MGARKHRRLPNGFGQITQLRGRNLRNPFRVLICVGKDENGKPICKSLKPKAYFKTYNEAYSALLEYHRNPFDVGSSVTLRDLYERWSAEYFETNSQSTVNLMRAAWSYCSSMYDLQVSEIRVRHLRIGIEGAALQKKGRIVKASANMQVRIKSMLNMMFDYAVEYELTDKNYARSMGKLKSVEKDAESNKKEHIAFTDEEMSKMWNAADKYKGVQLVLIQCYSGWRPRELGLIELTNVNINDWTFTGGVKTDAGKDRVVPIHPRIRPFVVTYYNEAKIAGFKYLFGYHSPLYPDKLIQMTYDRYKTIFNEVISSLNLNPDHRPHDPRKQFVTMAKKASVDEYAIKRIVGHVITDLTERVYTERDLEWLRSEIEKI